MIKQLLSIFFFFIMLCQSSFATHIVGGEITYECLGNNQYRINLTIFRDCDTGVPWFDDPAAIGIFNQNDQLVNTLFMPLSTVNDTLDPTLSDPCLAVPPNVCIHRTTYSAITTLAYTPGGYQLAYQRCCRNQDIVNIQTPLETGATYYTFISGLALLECNTSATFNEWPPVYICRNFPINFDHSATDIDGDSIVYEMCNPLEGADQFNPMPQPPNNPPYSSVLWGAGFGLNNMLGNAADPLAIDPSTGLLTGTPLLTGVFVVGICAKEYRNGQLISTTRRDFQYAIGLCGQLVAASFFTPTQECNDSRTVFFNNQSQAIQDNYRWYFDTTNLAATSTFKFPTYTYPDTGTYTVMLIADPNTACADTTYGTVHVQNRAINVTANDITTCSDTAVLRALCPDDIAQGETITYQWSPNTGVIGGSNADSIVVLANQDRQYTVTVTNEFGCTDVTTVWVRRRTISANFSVQMEPCSDDLRVVFNNQSTGTSSYYWDFDISQPSDSSFAGSPIYTYPAPGDYTAMLIVERGTECADTVYRQIEVRQRAISVTTQDTTVCTWTGVVLRADCSEDIAQGETISYQWSPSTNILNATNTDSIVVWANQNLLYTVVVTNQYGCKDTATLQVTRQTNTAEFLAPIDYCHNSLTVNFNNQSQSASTYYWNFDTTDVSAFSTDAIPTYTYPDTGLYTVMLIADPGSSCADTFYRNVDVQLRGIEVNSIPIEIVCRFDTVVLRAICPNNLEDTISYLWSPGTNVLNGVNADSLVVWADQDLQYTVTVTNQYGCTDTAQTGVNITFLTPPLDIVALPDSVYAGMSAWLQATLDPDYTYVWQNDPTLSNTNTHDPYATPIVFPAVYYLTVTDGRGCYNRDSVVLHLRQPDCGNPFVFVPNTFTPNGDGLNDVLLVRGVNLTEVYLVVYNRWGEKIFESNDQNIGWDGTHYGKPLPPDVYGYYMRCRCGQGDEYFEKGNVTIMK